MKAVGVFGELQDVAERLLAFWQIERPFVLLDDYKRIVFCFQVFIRPIAIHLVDAVHVDELPIGLSRAKRKLRRVAAECVVGILSDGLNDLLSWFADVLHDLCEVWAQRMGKVVIMQRVRLGKYVDVLETRHGRIL